MRTSLNVPEDLLAAFDETWEAEGLENRSRALREAMREYVQRHSRLEGVSGEVVAVVAFDYEHERVIRDLHGVQHDYQDVITTASHVHQGEWCLETVFCRGPAERVRTLLYRLRDFDGVRRASVLSLTTVPE
ncbi:MAG: CopG family ribbon-helix-helix protein [Halolamina sp.]